MDRTCPHCGVSNLSVAHFCARCGQPLGAGPNTAGRARHPSPLAPPEGFRRCERATDLYFQTEAPSGGQRLLDTEGVKVLLFNGGYSLCEVVVRVEGLDDEGMTQFSVDQSVDELPRGREKTFEIPSYAISRPTNRLAVTLVRAKYSGSVESAS